MRSVLQADAFHPGLWVDYRPGPAAGFKAIVSRSRSNWGMCTHVAKPLVEGLPRRSLRIYMDAHRVMEYGRCPCFFSKINRGIEMGSTLLQGSSLVDQGSALKDAGRPLRFAVVGACATLTHIGFAWLFLLRYPLANPYVVNFIGYGLGFFVSYFGHRYLTFRATGSMARFLLVVLVGFGLNNLIVTFLLAVSASSFLAILVATAAVPVLTYIASSRWVFGRLGK